MLFSHSCCGHLFESSYNLQCREFRLASYYHGYMVFVCFPDLFVPRFNCSRYGYIYKGLKLNERSWICLECGTMHNQDFNAACNIKELGLKALLAERGKVKPVDCPLVDGRPLVLKSNGREKQEKRGGICIFKGARPLV